MTFWKIWRQQNLILRSEINWPDILQLRSILFRPDSDPMTNGILQIAHARSCRRILKTRMVHTFILKNDTEWQKLSLWIKKVSLLQLDSWLMILVNFSVIHTKRFRSNWTEIALWFFGLKIYVFVGFFEQKLISFSMLEQSGT